MIRIHINLDHVYFSSSYQVQARHYILSVAYYRNNQTLSCVLVQPVYLYTSEQESLQVK